MQAVLDELTALGGKPLPSLSPAEARQQPSPADAVASLMKKRGLSTPEQVASVVDGVAGEIPVRIYTPQGEAPFPVIFYVHGGGWVIGDLDSYDASARALANAAKAIVVSTHYRQAPEYKFPASHDDVFQVYQWTALNIHLSGGDPSRMAVAGESAGANMALDAVIRARDTERSIAPVALLLVYPVADTSMRTASYKQHAEARPLNAAMMAWFFSHELATADQAKDPRLNLVDAPSERFHSLPPTTIITADLDPLRSEGEKLADKIRDAKSQVTLRNFEGVTHEFFGMGAVVDQAKAAVQFAAQSISSYFGERPQ